jgi:hypothetical protein
MKFAAFSDLTIRKFALLAPARTKIIFPHLI